MNFLPKTKSASCQEQLVVEGVLLSVPRDVYLPREDSLLLAKAVKRFAFGKFFDVGCGSGLQSIVAAKNKKVVSVTGVDVNPSAVATSKENAASNGVAKECVFVKGNLFSPFKKGKDFFDCVAFNPPYLPTSQDEHVKGGLDKAFDGGQTGRKQLDEFICKVGGFLSPKGVVLLVSSSLSSSEEFADGNKETLEKLSAAGFKAEKIASEKFFFEEIAVFKACR